MEALLALLILATGISVGIRSMSEMLKITRRSLLLHQASFFSRELLLKMENNELDFSKIEQIDYTPKGLKDAPYSLKAQGTSEEFELEMEAKTTQVGGTTGGATAPESADSSTGEDKKESENTYEAVHLELKRGAGETIARADTLICIVKTSDSEKSATTTP